MIEQSSTIQMLNPRGRVISAPIHLKKSLLEQGYKLIVNPKSEWYPNYDIKGSGWDNNLNVMENIEPSNFLEVEKI